MDTGARHRNAQTAPWARPAPLRWAGWSRRGVCVCGLAGSVMQGDRGWFPAGGRSRPRGAVTRHHSLGRGGLNDGLTAGGQGGRQQGRPLLRPRGGVAGLGPRSSAASPRPRGVTPCVCVPAPFLTQAPVALARSPPQRPRPDSAASPRASAPSRSRLRSWGSEIMEKKCSCSGEGTQKRPGDVIMSPPQGGREHRDPRAHQAR